MATPYRYVGESARDYPTLGIHVEPGDTLYLDGRAPDDRFVVVEVPAGEQPGVAADYRGPLPDEDPKQPNKAASAEEWKAYALAHGGFEDATGTHPDDATRRAIVEHYTAEQTPADDGAPAAGETPQE